MSAMHGFEPIAEHPLPEHRGRGLWLRHARTGAEVYHVANDDEENLFAFVFKTLPSDSTGVAHILEHAVLCGSRRFPVKDPFILLVKGSLNTFLNALTYPDKTVYPAASTVERDLFNIMEVYGDAVFFPLLRPEFFRQEGHRVQFGADGRLEISGVVYNEMRGNYAHHDSIAADLSHRALLPDTPYGFDSGGDPAVIPDLTYEQFAAFHATHYHPSNTRVFLYGNVPTGRYLEFLDERLFSRFDRLAADLAVPLQPRWREPREVEATCPVDGEEGTTSVTTSWLLDGAADPARLLGYQLLDQVLLGSSAGPLRKALIESGLGEDLSAPTGLETDLLEAVFSAGLRGTEPGRRDEVRSLVLESLERIVNDGINADIVEAALRRVEFRNREIRGGAPNGLRLMGRSLRGWLHGQSPDATLRFEEPFRRLREAASPGSRYFESLVQTALVANPHRVTVTVRPDPGHTDRDRAAVAARLASVERGLSPADRERLAGEQATLEALQSTPDAPEQIASIPSLTVADLPRELPDLPASSFTAAGVTVYTHEVPANGVVYADAAFDLDGLPAELLPYVPLYTGVIGELGLPGRSYDEVATEIDLKTGGFAGLLESVVPVGAPGVDSRYAFFRVKALEHTLPEALDLASEIILRSDFGNETRLAELVREAKSSVSGSVLPSGHAFAAVRAGRSLSAAHACDEVWRGATQLLFLDRLERAGLAEVSRALSRIGELLIRRGNLTLNITGSREALERAAPLAERFAAAVPEGGWGDRDCLPAQEVVRAEALLVPSDVSYVAIAMRSARIGSPHYVHEEVLAHLLRTGYLWEAIRMKGGAYGANARASGTDAVFSFTSYRDPRILETVEACRAALEHYASGGPVAEELERAIIGVTGHHIRPMSPGEKSMTALRRTLYGVTDELRQENHRVLLGTRAGDVRAAAERLLAALDHAVIVVLGGSRSVSRAAGSIPELGRNQVALPV